MDNKEKICTCGLIKTKETIRLFPKSGRLCNVCNNNRLRDYYSKNKEKISKRKKEFRIKNGVSYKDLPLHEKERRNRVVNASKRKRRKNNNLYALTETIRCSINYGFRKNGFIKTTKTIEILGCSWEEFKRYIESKFELWMNWNNRGLYNGSLNYGWDIDHIIPISSAETIEELIKLNHYTNLQPLCSYVNRNIKKNN